MRIVISIDLPYACFGIVVEAGVVVEAAPIAHWATGKDAKKVLTYYHRKGAKIERCTPWKHDTKNSSDKPPSPSSPSPTTPEPTSST